MNVKAQGLLNAATWIEQTYGQPALRDIVRSCSPELRDRYTSAIAINWHPMSELVEFLAAAETIVGTGDGKLTEEIGAAGARTNMRGTLTRLVFYISKPEFLMKRIAQLWSQFNDAGSMELLHVGDFTSSIEVKGVPDPSWLFCCTLTGWTREVVTAMGGHEARARHIECRARGATRCVWKATWSGVSSQEAAAREVDKATRRVGQRSSKPPPPSKPRKGNGE